MNNPILEVVMRYLHIVSAIVTVGGMAFVLLCVSPVSKMLDEELRKKFIKAVHERFLRVVWVAIVVLIITGTYTWIQLNSAYTQIKPWGQALIGTKVLLALVLFIIVWLRSIGKLGMTPKGAKRVLMSNIHLGAIIILIASTLRYLRMSHGL